MLWGTTRGDFPLYPALVPRQLPGDDVSPTNMNAELVKKALEKVLNPHVLVNMVSQRVRQLNSGFGGRCNPLIANTANLGMSDIALLEIIEDKMSFEMPRSSNWSARAAETERSRSTGRRTTGPDERIG